MVLYADLCLTRSYRFEVVLLGCFLLAVFQVVLGFALLELGECFLSLKKIGSLILPQYANLQCF